MGTLSVLVGEKPQAICVDAAQPPKLNDSLAALFMSAMTCVLALRAVCHDKVIVNCGQELNNRLLKLLRWQWRLIRPVIQVSHFALCPQSSQNAVESRRTVRIACSAQGYNPPTIIRVGQDIATAPERFIIWMGYDNSGTQTELSS